MGGALTWEVKGHGSVAALRQQLQCAQLLPRVGVKGLSMEQYHLHPAGTQRGEGPAGLAVCTQGGEGPVGLAVRTQGGEGLAGPLSS